METKLIIECPFCESKVSGNVIGEHKFTNSYDEDFKVALVDCPVCHAALLGLQETLQTGMTEFEWSAPKRVWPLA